MCDKEYEEYQQFKKRKADFERMKQNGELFYVDCPPVKTQPICKVTQIKL